MKIFRRPVNVIIQAEGATKRTRFTLGIKDDYGVDEERGKCELNKIDSWTKKEGVRAAEKMYHERR